MVEPRPKISTSAIATRPLSLDELRWAMLVDADCSLRSLVEGQNAGDYPSDDDGMEKRVQTLSCGLAEVTSDTKVVQFIHQSVKDFFIEKGLPALDASPTISWCSATTQPSRARKVIYEQLASLYAQLRRLEFPEIGALGLPRQDESAIYVRHRPLSIEVLLQQGEGLEPTIMFREKTTFKTSRDYINALLWLGDNLLSKGKNSMVNSRGGDRTLYATHSFKRFVTEQWFDPALDHGPFVLMHGDLGIQNLLWDENLNLVAVIDWEWSSVIPLQLLVPPPWLNGQDTSFLCYSQTLYNREVGILCDMIRDKEKTLGLRRLPLLSQEWATLKDRGNMMKQNSVISDPRCLHWQSFQKQRGQQDAKRDQGLLSGVFAAMHFLDRAKEAWSIAADVCDLSQEQWDEAQRVVRWFVCFIHESFTGKTSRAPFAIPTKGDIWRMIDDWESGQVLDVDQDDFDKSWQREERRERRRREQLRQLIEEEVRQFLRSDEFRHLDSHHSHHVSMRMTRQKSHVVDDVRTGKVRHWGVQPYLSKQVLESVQHKMCKSCEMRFASAWGPSLDDSLTLRHPLAPLPSHGRLRLYDFAGVEGMEIDDAASLKRLHMDDTYMGGGHKCRATGPPALDGSLPTSSDGVRHRDTGTHGSPTPRLANNVPPLPRSNSYGSTASIAPSSAATANSYEHRSPGAYSSGGVSPISGNSPSIIMLSGRTTKNDSKFSTSLY
ncbi:hypothetical protein ACJZ2D_017124 [Fusarium nematophilum]